MNNSLRRSTASPWPALIRGSFLLVPLAVLLVTLVGCGSAKPERPATRPGGGIAEYRQVVSEAREVIQNALTALNRLPSEPNQVSPEVVSAFSAELQNLQVRSMPLRARALAMEARGDEYFRHWDEHISEVRDPEFRSRANQRRPELDASFRKILNLSKEARESLVPFQSNLRSLRNSLESNPASIGAQTTRDLVATTRERGQEADERLAQMLDELDAMREMLGLKPQRKAI